MGVKRLETPQPGLKPAKGKRAYTAQRQDFLIFPAFKLMINIFYSPERFVQSVIEDRGFLCELQAAGLSSEKRDTQTLLKNSYLLADGGWGNEQLFRGPGKAEVPGGSFKRFEGFQGRVFSHSTSFRFSLN
uniref:Uncharacterized protein n=1 Tax=Klebsiella pneumoniae TaxID=573 RepID=A0A455TME4_KLEPN|nr:hypothetical protein [Klebsiella pneumoniae]